MNGDKRNSADDIADRLRERIRSGELTAGSRLPTQTKLADEFEVDRGVVRDAMRRLQKEGLLSNVSKGSPPTVASPPEPLSGAQPTLVGLAPRLEAAFGVTEVSIDAVCLTAETLLMSMAAPMGLIEAGRLQPPKSVTARIVLPSKDLKLLYPAPADGWGKDEVADTAVHERSKAQYIAQITVLRQYFRRLSLEHNVSATVHFRVVDNTPYQKVYLLNDSEVLVAHYTVERRTMDVDGVERELWDAWGTQSLLFPFEAKHGARDAEFVKETKRWFEALWETLEPDLKEP